MPSDEMLPTKRTNASRPKGGGSTPLVTSQLDRSSTRLCHVTEAAAGEKSLRLLRLDFPPLVSAADGAQSLGVLLRSRLLLAALMGCTPGLLFMPDESTSFGPDSLRRSSHSKDNNASSAITGEGTHLCRQALGHRALAIVIVLEKLGLHATLLEKSLE